MSFFSRKKKTKVESSSVKIEHARGFLTQADESQKHKLEIQNLNAHIKSLV